MAQPGDVVVHLTDSIMEQLGVTKEEVEEHPAMTRHDYKLIFAVTEACRKALVGEEGSISQLLAVPQLNEGLAIGPACLFLVKNRIKPLARDVLFLADMVKVSAKRLSELDLVAITRCLALFVDGTLSHTGDDVVPDNVRAEWLVVSPTN